MYIAVLFCFFFVKVNSYGWVRLLDLKSYNTKKPSSIQVLDKELVIWEKNNQIWIIIFRAIIY